MAERPYTILSCSMSLDGYIDSAADERLLLSNEADFDRVDEVRAGCDAILVGAATVRNDDPALLVRSEQRRQRRLAAGKPESPVKVTLTKGGDLDPAARFFTQGSGEKLVYCPSTAMPATAARVGRLATVVDAGAGVTMSGLRADLHARGVRRLMVEGGGTVHTQFLTEGQVDELQLVVAPFFVGDSGARRFVYDGRFPWCAEHRATLVEARPIGDVVLLRYAMSDRFRRESSGGGV
ncbi:RibD family protein [Nocardioides speluncae]|uniref:RibD family protein n=1 Tax=Nocardioides speluncae TaxID=2670337 RepID=UPI000D69A3C7|nr:dihydrofolate reductase family protein [Nocardioides speluncae]